MFKQSIEDCYVAGKHVALLTGVPAQFDNVSLSMRCPLEHMMSGLEKALGTGLQTKHGIQYPNQVWLRHFSKWGWGRLEFEGSPR